MTTVAAFTDTYLPTVNGVTYTVRAWRDEFGRRGDRMDVVYPRHDGYAPDDGEMGVRSLPFPFYDGYRLGLPQVPRAVRDADLVHVHTPFSLGVAGMRLARRADLPVVASYHTPVGEYTNYLASNGVVAAGLRRVGVRWERLFLDRTDLVTAPSEATRQHLQDVVGVTVPVRVLPNGVDVERFEPTNPAAFIDAHDLDTGGPLVGYTGRHGFEKCLDELVDAAAGLDVTVVLAGDGPARPALERRARQADADVRFLGFLDREDLAAFYSALDVFAFPSPVETQGIVALEAMACGTPVVGADRAALAETIDAGRTGYHYESGDTAGFREAILRALERRTELAEACLARREAASVERSVDRLEAIYARLD